MLEANFLAVYQMRLASSYAKLGLKTGKQFVELIFKWSYQNMRKEYRKREEIYLGCFAFSPGLRCARNIMIRFIESLLTPVACAPSIWEPTTPSDKGMRQKKQSYS